MDIYKALDYISSKAFPQIKQDWSFYKIDDDRSLFMVVGWLHTVGDYISDNYLQGLSSLIKIIEKNELAFEEQKLAEKLVVALATNYINLHSDIPQNKQEVAFSLYKNNPTFRAATNMYAEYSNKLISNIVAYALFKLDKEALESLCYNCISKYRSDKEAFYKLIEQIRDEFKWNHSISSWVTGQNILEYWEIGLYFDVLFPELQFFETRDGDYIRSIKNEIDEIEALVPIREMFDNGDLWINLNELPDFLRFEYIYPNGKNGDIVRYILEEYGVTTEVAANLWKGEIHKDYIDLFEMLAPNALKISSDEAFLQIFEHHIPSILYKKRMELFASKVAARGRFHELGEKIKNHKLKQGKKRAEVYSQLVLEKRTSPKWKSEAQLFTLVSSIYPDAIYQYHVEWLGMQSLDIFIPSLSIGIEYQGKQHYTPIEHFGGEKHFEKQQENDRRKKKLCSENGVRLIEWPYQEQITEENLMAMLSQ